MASQGFTLTAHSTTRKAGVIGGYPDYFSAGTLEIALPHPYY